MKAWNDRPIIVANLFNPAFCGQIIRSCVDEYSKITHTPFPFVLAFLILPIILHKKTRTKLPTSIKKSFHDWLEENPDVKINFSTRCQQTIQFTRESIMFLLINKAAILDENGNIEILSYKKIKNKIDNETSQCIQKAAFLGRWFSKAGDVQTIFYLWGVKP